MTTDLADARPAARVLTDKLGDAVLEVRDDFGDLSLQLEPGALFEAAKLLKEHPELRFEFLMDIAAVDHYGAALRFELVYIFYSLEHKARARLHLRLPAEAPSVASLVPLWKGADWFEREAWDMMGVRFDGHPRLARILTHPEFVGHPLRKDYDAGQRHPLSRNYDLFDDADLAPAADPAPPVAD